MSNDVLYETEKYSVKITREALGEDGTYSRHGYAVINKDTGITEHTTMMLPAAIFQCQHFNDTLVSLLTPEPKTDMVDIFADPTDGDVLPN